MNVQPRAISIITVALNSAGHIRQAIESVIAQGNDRLQYIVIDGKSTDDTVAIVESYRPAFGDRLFVVSENDNGLYDAMNKGITLATGEVIGILNSDDAYLPGALLTVENVFLSESADIVYGDTEIVYSGETRTHRAEVSELPDHMSLDHPACFVRRTVYARRGAFDTRYKIAADYDFLLRCYLDGARFVKVNQVLARFQYGGVSSASLETSRREVYDIQAGHLGRAHAQWCQIKRMTADWLVRVRRTVGVAIIGQDRYERMRIRWRRARAERLGSSSLRARR